MAAYEEPGKLFTCEAPAEWRVLEGQGGAQRVSFLGPPGGESPFAASISIYYYAPGSAFRSPEDYAAGRAMTGAERTPVAEKPWKGEKALEFSLTRRQLDRHGKTPARILREDAFLVSSGKGFIAVIHSAPPSLRPKTEPVFRALLESLALRNMD